MFREIVKPGTQIDFLGKRRIALIVSVSLIALGLLAIPLRGIQWGIDFAGGIEVQVRFTGDETVDEGSIRAIVADMDITGASVIRYGLGDAREFLLKFPGDVAQGWPVEGASADGDEAAPDAEGDTPEIATSTATTPEERVAFKRALETALADGIGPLEVERLEFVGPKVGSELRRDGLLSLSVACALILVYIGFRFSLRFAPGAVVALVHDVLITAGVWVILGFEFDLRVLAALLAIIGYSLNDTIIVYDRIRENMELRTKHDLEDVLNRSVNQTLSRTLLTSLTTLLAVLSLLFLGGSVVRPFALAMAIGIVIGTYSSIYVAAATLLALENRYGTSS